MIEMPKSGIYKLEGPLPAGVHAGLNVAGEEVDGVFRRGFVVFGAPVGEEEYVDRKLTEVVTRIMKDARRTVEVLGRDRQALWCTLHP